MSIISDSEGKNQLINVYPNARPYIEVESASPELRLSWFKPQPLAKIDMRIVAAILIGGLVLGAAIYPVFFLAGLGGVFYYVRSVRIKRSQPVEATSRRTITSERRQAESWVVSNIGPRLGLQPTDGLSDDLILAVSEALGEVLWVDRQPIVKRVKITAFAVTHKGLVHMSFEFDAISNAFVPSTEESELLHWKKVSRVRQANGRLLVESVGGSTIGVSLTDDPSIASSSGISMRLPNGSELAVSAFVAAARNYLDQS